MSSNQLPELVSCPQCRQVASIEWTRTTLEMGYVKIRCIARHWFLMSAEDITCHASDRPYLATAESADSRQPTPSTEEQDRRA